MSEICNLAVDLTATREGAQTPAGIEIAPPAAADERTLAWIDDAFGGWWSSEAYAGTNLIARRNGAPVGFATIDPKGMRFSWLRGFARESGVGIFGPLGVAADERGRGIGRALLERALTALRERGYSRALISAVGDERLVGYYGEHAGAVVAERFERNDLLAAPPRTLVLASGNGGNFQAVLDAVRGGALRLEIAGLISNNPRAYAIERARAGGVPAQIVGWDRQGESRAQYDARLLEVARSLRPALVLLLGWMHLLAEPFVRAFPDMLNLHPAFLPLDPRSDAVVLPDGSHMPAFRGARAVRDALAASSEWVGATLHRVTAQTDRGPVMARKPLRVERGEDEAHLMKRVHAVEHRLVVAGITRRLFESEAIDKRG